MGANSVSISLGQYAIGRGNGEEWVIFGLGSCIGLILLNPVSRVSGMAHIVLPRAPSPEPNPWEPVRYADTGVAFLVAAVARLSGDRGPIWAMMVGGARILDQLADIGSRNIEAVREALAGHRIPVVAERVGGTKSYTLRWNPLRACARVRQACGPEERVMLLARGIWEVDPDGTGTGG